MAAILLNLDVDDIERAIVFYTQAFELRLGRRFDSEFVELLGAEAPISRARLLPAAIRRKGVRRAVGIP